MTEINIDIQIELNIHNSSHLAHWLSFRFRHSSTPNLPRLLIILVHKDEEEEIETPNCALAVCDRQGLISEEVDGGRTHKRYDSQFETVVKN